MPMEEFNRNRLLVQSISFAAGLPNLIGMNIFIAIAAVIAIAMLTMAFLV